MNRRTLLHAAAAAPVAGFIHTQVFAPAEALPAPPPAVPPQETAVMAAFRDWQAYCAWLNGPETRGMDEDDEDQFLALCGVAWDKLQAMLELPSSDAADLALKFFAFCEDSAAYYRDPRADLFRAQVRSVLGVQA